MNNLNKICYNRIYRAWISTCLIKFQDELLNIVIQTFESISENM